MHSEVVSWPVAGDVVAGQLHRPHAGAEAAPPPVVVMGNGFATEWQFGTLGYVAAFVDAGLAVLTFDYRHFGASSGQPRQLIDIQRQLNDWRGAIAWVRRRSDLDSTRLGVWGSSLGGGHALSLAAEDHGISAVVAQVPLCDSRAAFGAVGWLRAARGLGHALYDRLRASLGMKPHEVPAVAEHGFAIMGFAGWEAGYLGIVTAGSRWRNAVPARSLLSTGDYRPIETAANIRCPTLLIAGEHDAGVPLASVKATAARIPEAELISYPGDHFDIYQGPVFERMAPRQVRFWQQHLQ